MTGVKINWQTEYKSYKKERMKELIDKLGKGMAKACLIVERQAKENVSKSGSSHPQVVTGRLRSSITSQVITEKDVIYGAVGTNVVYGPFLEFGTRNMPPYPWLFPALEEKREEVTKALTEGGGAAQRGLGI